MILDLMQSQVQHLIDGPPRSRVVMRSFFLSFGETVL